MKRLLLILSIAGSLLGGGLFLSGNSSKALCATGGGFCKEAGCEGGSVNCYSPPQGGMCYTKPNIIME